MKRLWKKLNLDKVDWVCFFVVALITVIGLFNLYSATYELPLAKYFSNQVIWVLAGMMICFILTLVHYNLYYRLAYVFYIGTNLLLLYVLLFGKSAGGSQRWIPLGFFHLQPSELAKIAIVIGLAKYFHTHLQRKEMHFTDLIVPILITALPCLFILKQPDLGTTLVVFFTAVMMTWFIGVQRKIIVISFLIGLISIPVIWNFGLKDYQKDRVISFMQPEKYADSKGYQIIQSKIAAGSGQLTGKGYLKGTQSKLQFLPKQHTDFVFSNYGEEFGFLGSAFLFLLYFLFGMSGINIAVTSREVFGVLVAYGLTTSIMIQTIINLGMELGLLPVVGMTLPFFSYGGTSMMTSFIALGILLNISMFRLIHASNKI